jgi:CreA protein
MDQANRSTQIRSLAMTPAQTGNHLLACLGAAALLIASAAPRAEVIGSVATKFKWVGPSDKIVVEVFQDEDIPGVACYLSRAKTGGISGAVGVAEDTSDASIECTQIGPIDLPDEVRSGKRDGEEVFKKRTSLLFKTLQVVRFYDAPRNALVYLTYSDRIIEGSPKNSITVVAVQPWAAQGAAARPPSPPAEQ